MKILFAVSNENVSRKIVESYQNKYGEKVNFKNVFYFNAIIREIHKDKTYDRIVISEDLEPFSSSNFELIDKFILERMKRIANEISSQERYIDTVLICTDRRTKSSYIISKFYEYGIYNALVGQDRRIDNVCKLINTPRNAKEAQEYYKIGSQNDTSSVDDVSEQEVQNILIHYKRLGKNEDRYTDSFNNIASQYTDKQLKIIIKCLPLNVRAVLEAECPKYQELVTYSEETEEERKQKRKMQEQRKLEQIENDRKIRQKIEKEKREKERENKRKEIDNKTKTENTNNRANFRSGIDLIDNKHKEPRMTGNVIIPNNMNIKNERKVYTEEELEEISNKRANNTLSSNKKDESINNKKPIATENEPVQTINKENIDVSGFRSLGEASDKLDNESKTKDIGIEDLDDNTGIFNGMQNKTASDFNIKEENANIAVSNIPNISISESQLQDNNNENNINTDKQFVETNNEIMQESKRGRGRPRKYPIEPPKPKGKRGRPRKNPIPEEEELKHQIIPGVNDFDNIPELDKIGSTESTKQNNSIINNNQGSNSLNEDSSSKTEFIPGFVDLNNDTFEEKENQSTILSGLDDFEQEINTNQENNNKSDEDWNKEPFEEIASQSNTLPGLDDWNQEINTNQENNNQSDEDWNRDPFEETTNQSNTLPGLDDWNQEINTNQENNNQSDEDWNRDPFEETTNQSNTLPGLDDWNQEINTNQENKNQSDEDWNRDPFEETTNQSNTLPGLDDWNQEINTNQENNNQSDEDWNKDPFEETTNQSNTLPGLDDWNQEINTNQENNNQSDEDWNRDPFEETTNQSNTLPGLDNWNQEINTNQENNNQSDEDWNKDPFEEFTGQTNMLPEMNNNYSQQPKIMNGTEKNNTSIEKNSNEYAVPYSPSKDRKESLRKIEEDRLYSTGSLETVLTKDKKIVAFVGASKSGTSFLVNNLACLFSSIGVKTAILDMTKNKNSYYIYTDNNEDLRKIAYTSIEKLEEGTAEGIKVDRNLNVYTALPNDNKDYSNAEAILSTVVQNESLVLIDCDFDTDFSYFANCQEIFLVQSMDILTIQPLTVFLRELKTKGLLDEEKLRIVINKELRVKGLSSKAVIGGMSFYIDPAMSFMTDLFNKDKIKACSIPFDENVYAKYIEQTVNCSISISGYNKNFINSLKILGNMVYPLLSKQTYNSLRSVNEARNYGNNFSNEMNNTLNQMKKKY